MIDQRRAIVGAIAIRVIRILYRLALFPWLTVMQLGWTMASQVNWLMTGMTFADVDQINRQRKDIDHHFMARHQRTVRN